MENDAGRGKIEAIYQLREAVEAKAHAEAALEQDASPAARDALLAAQLDVEAKTQDAIDVCHECGHSADDGHSHPPRRSAAKLGDNVVYVDFRRGPSGV